MKVNLFFLVDGKQLGGCTSYVAHLFKALEAIGHQPTIYRIGKMVPTGPRAIDFPYGLRAYAVSAQYMKHVASSAPSIIAYCFWKKHAADAKPLIEMGVPMVVHDPAEFHDDELTLFKSIGYSPIVIRKANVTGLRELGVSARYLPHPFVPTKVPSTLKVVHALSLARIDFRKRSHVIIEASKILDREEKGVLLYGEINRIYEFHQLRKLHPDWRRWYRGEFPDRFGQATLMFSTARFAVDLTHIQGDGGGTQYTFFEAWNAGIPLVLNRAWAHDHEDEVVDGDSCVMVDGANELVEVLRRPADSFARIVEGGARLLREHAPETVGPLYLDVMNERV